MHYSSVAHPAGAKRSLSDPGQPVPKFSRGDASSTRGITDKKLKGSVKRAEQVTSRAVAEAKKVYEWLLPAQGGALVAEGAERTWQFQQKDIVKV